MFGFLKQKLVGAKIWSMEIPGYKPAEVYIWKRDGAYTLRISSERGSYGQGPGFDWKAVWFDPNQLPALAGAIEAAQTQLRSLMHKGQVA